MATHKRPFDRTIASPFPITDGDPQTGLIIAGHSFQAMQEMLGALLEKGEDISPHVAQGIYFMLETQRLILAGITNEVGTWADERHSAAKSNVSDDAVPDTVRKLREDFITSSAEAGTHPKVIAQALNMRRSSIERVIGQLRGSAPVAPEAMRAASA